MPNLARRLSVQDKSILITGATAVVAELPALADASAADTGRRQPAGLAELVNGAGIDDAAGVTPPPDSLADAQQMVEAHWPMFDGVLVASQTMWRPLPRWPPRTSTSRTWVPGWCRAAGRVLLEQGQGGRLCRPSSRRLGQCRGRPARTARRRRAPPVPATHWRPNGAVTVFAKCWRRRCFGPTEWMFTDDPEGPPARPILLRRFAEPEDLVGARPICSATLEPTPGQVMYLDGGHACRPRTVLPCRRRGCR